MAEIKVEKLKEVLTFVKPGVASKELMEQTSSFAFTNGTVVTYNDEISVRADIPEFKFSGVLEAEKLYSFLNKLDVSDLQYVEKGNELIFKAGRLRAGFTVQKEILLPIDNIQIQEVVWNDIDADFVTYMSQASVVCANDMSRPMFSCINVTKDGVIEATDSIRLLHIETKNTLDIDDFLLPAKTVQAVVRFAPEKIGTSVGWVHFMNDKGAVMSCRVFDDQFVDLTKFLHIEGENIVFPNTLLSVIERAKVFSKRDFVLEEVVILTLSNNRLKVYAESDAGWFEEILNMRYKGEELTFSISPTSLTSILKETRTAVLSERLLLFETENWKYVTAYNKIK